MDFQQQTLAKLDYIAKKISQNDSDRKSINKTKGNEDYKRTSSRQRDPSAKQRHSIDSATKKGTSKNLTSHTTASNARNEVRANFDVQYKLHTGGQNLNKSPIINNLAVGSN